MNNIIGSYLMFKANNVCEYIKVVAEEDRKLSKVPKHLNKLVYKYYDLFVLGKENIDLEMLKNKTGLVDTKERLILFYLLIEFDIASKTEYRNEKYYELYNFLVNFIIIFTSLENEAVNKKKFSYDEEMDRILKKYIDIINDNDINLIDMVWNSLSKKYLDNRKKELKFNELYNSNNYSIVYTKVKKSNEFYFEKLKYKNERLLTESKKDILLVNKEFLLELNLINIEMTLMRVVKDTLNGIDRVVFVELNDEIISKKSNLSLLKEIVKLRFLKEKIIFLVNISLLEKFEERINILLLEGFKMAYYKDCKLFSYDSFKSGGYLVVDYDSIDEGISFAKKNNLELIVDKVNKLDDSKIKNIMYVNR